MSNSTTKQIRNLSRQSFKNIVKMSFIAMSPYKSSLKDYTIIAMDYLLQKNAIIFIPLLQNQ